MEPTHAVILSVVEGITEFLPISSTGHLVLVSKLLGIAQTEFLKSFEISIQLGAILAVVVLYRRTLLTSVGIWQKVLVAFVPTGVAGFVFYGFVKSTLLGNIPVTLIALLLGGVFLIVFEKIYEKEKDLDVEQMSWKQSVFIGFSQSVSMIPGVSRAAASIIGGLLVGLNRKAAVEFSFLLAIPTMLAATGLDLFKTRLVYSNEEYILLLVGFIGAFLTAVLSIKFLLSWVSRHSFVAFGVYRIVVAIVFWLFVTRG